MLRKDSYIDKKLLEAIGDIKRTARILCEISPSLTLWRSEQQENIIYAECMDGPVSGDGKAIQQAVLDIYLRTGRIILDATAIGNFMARKSSPSELVCVDPDYAIKRRLSVVSDRIAKEFLPEDFCDHWSEMIEIDQQLSIVVATIILLLVIDRQYGEEIQTLPVTEQSGKRAEYVETYKQSIESINNMITAIADGKKFDCKQRNSLRIEVIEELMNCTLPASNKPCALYRK